jgi:transglutaminase-like putative cysteine protease
VHLQNLTSDVLFFAGTPESLSINAASVERSAANDSYRLPPGLMPPISYQAWTFLQPPRGSVALRMLPPAEREQYLQLPRVNPRVAALAQEWSAGLNSPEQKAEALERHLRKNFRYSLQLGPVPAADPIADFLLVRRAGHCEYFASSMAVMLRTIGIPSRVVTGFQSGVYNPVSGWLVIRASDAHSWVEAWLPHLGWTVFDPTPPDPNAGIASIWTRIGFYFDAAETFWQEWVLNYNIDRQVLLALKMQETTRSSGTGWIDRTVAWADHARVAATAFLMRWGAILAMGLIAAALIIYFGPRVRLRWHTRQRVLRAQRGQAQASDATLLYTRMLNLLSRRGFEKPAWTTPVEFARGLPPSDLAPLVEDLTTAYNELRFGAKADAAGRMIVLLEHLERL